VKPRLDSVPIPDGAEERAHRVAMSAFSERKPTPRRRTYWRPAIAVVAAAAVAGVLASPPGRSVIQSIREAVGVKHAAPALFQLPAPGRLLVNSAHGPWVVEQGGSKRLLGAYREASWSPFGRFVVALRNDELVTMEPNGKVHWTLARPGLSVPAWGGKHSDTRIAYLTRHNLHVVAGDGTGDAMKCADGLAPVAPAWRPGSLSVLAFAAPNGRVQVYDVSNCRLILRTPPGPLPMKLEWSSDGKLLLVVSSHVQLYDAHGRLVVGDDPAGGSPDLDATFVGASETVVVLRTTGLVFRLGDGRSIFRGTGLRRLVSSPDGHWLLLTWPAANQWVFVRVQAPHRIRAFSGITRQFGGGAFPSVSGWIGK
jgi:hypothetical protein